MMSLDLGVDLPPVPGDRVQLQQVILNLLINGVEAMSQVEDRPRELLIQSCRHGAEVALVAVRDVGIGLDPQQAERIFDSFYTTKPKGWAGPVDQPIDYRGAWRAVVGRTKHRIWHHVSIYAAGCWCG